MLKWKVGHRLLIVGLFLFQFSSATEAWAIAANYLRGYPLSNPYSNKNPQFRHRFGYIPQGSVLPGTNKVRKKCIPHGQARCIGSQKEDRYPSRYVNRDAEMNSIHPRLRARNPYKYKQNW